MGGALLVGYYYSLPFYGGLTTLSAGGGVCCGVALCGVGCSFPLVILLYNARARVWVPMYTFETP